MIVNPGWQPDLPKFSSIGEAREYFKKDVNSRVLKLWTSTKEFLEHKDSVDVIRALLKTRQQGWRDVCLNYPQYAPEDDLLKYNSDYPSQFITDSEVEFDEPYGEYTLLSEPISHRVKPSENRIRNLRLDEVWPLCPLEFKQRIAVNSYKYTGLELSGIILWLYLAEPSKDYLHDYFFKFYDESKHGLELRARLKPVSTSIKRWPEYWKQRYGASDYQDLIEVESILGYIIVEQPTEKLIDSIVDALLTDKTINWLDTEDSFWSTIDQVCIDWNSDKDVLDLTFDEFLDDWASWSRSGSASEVRVNINDKKYRVNKTALPLVLDKETLINSPLQPSRAILKAETGKSRFVLAAGTKQSLVTMYFIKKYPGVFMPGNEDDYIGKSTYEKLLFSSSVMDDLVEEEYLASADIEQNDLNHDSSFDCYSLATSAESFIRPDDTELFCWLLSTYSCSWLLFNTKLDVPRATYRKGTKVHVVGKGIVASGIGITYYANNKTNKITSVLGQKLAIHLLTGTKQSLCRPKVSSVAGGDDFWAKVIVYLYGILMYVCMTLSYLRISYSKSYISNTRSEFYRVGYSKSAREGYPNRVIHSLVSTNPVSAQEIDIVSKSKAYVAVIQTYVRRSPHTLYRTESLLKLYLRHHDLPDEIYAIPVELGGLGIGAPSMIKAVPGIPRFKLPTIDLVPADWSKTVFLKSYPIDLDRDGVFTSLVKDMMVGVRDPDARKLAKESYKKGVERWLAKVKFKQHKPEGNFYKVKDLAERLKNALSMIAVNSTYTETVEATRKLARSVKPSYPEVNHTKYQLVSDIINRARTEKVSDKINILTKMGLVNFGYLKNLLPAKLLLDAVTDSFTSNSLSYISVPPDCSWYLHCADLRSVLLSRCSARDTSYSLTYIQHLLVEKSPLMFRAMFNW